MFVWCCARALHAQGTNGASHAAARIPLLLQCSYQNSPQSFSGCFAAAAMSKAPRRRRALLLLLLTTPPPTPLLLRRRLPPMQHEDGGQGQLADTAGCPSICNDASHRVVRGRRAGSSSDGGSNGSGGATAAPAAAAAARAPPLLRCKRRCDEAPSTAPRNRMLSIIVYCYYSRPVWPTVLPVSSGFMSRNASDLRAVHSA